MSYLRLLNDTDCFLVTGYGQSQASSTSSFWESVSRQLHSLNLQELSSESAFKGLENVTPNTPRSAAAEGQVNKMILLISNASCYTIKNAPFGESGLLLAAEQMYVPSLLCYVQPFIIQDQQCPEA